MASSSLPIRHIYFCSNELQTRCAPESPVLKTVAGLEDVVPVNATRARTARTWPTVAVSVPFEVASSAAERRGGWQAEPEREVLRATA
jgi:hypothetical protein